MKLFRLHDSVCVCDILPLSPLYGILDHINNIFSGVDNDQDKNIKKDKDKDNSEMRCHVV